MSEIPGDVMRAASKWAAQCYQSETGTWFDVRDVIARAIMSERAAVASAAVAERQDALFNRVLSDPLVRSVVSRPAPTQLAEREPDSDRSFLLRNAVTRVSELEAENARLRDRAAELEKALEPFAAVAEHDIGDDETDDDIFWPISNARYSMSGRLRVAHLRAARRARKGGKEDG